jgi:hypothetical protein
MVESTSLLQRVRSEPCGMSRSACRCSRKINGYAFESLLRMQPRPLSLVREATVKRDRHGRADRRAVWSPAFADGPVAPLYGFMTDAAAISVANNTEFGLSYFLQP